MVGMLASFLSYYCYKNIMPKATYRGRVSFSSEFHVTVDHEKELKVLGTQNS